MLSMFTGNFTFYVKMYNYKQKERSVAVCSVILQSTNNCYFAKAELGPITTYKSK